MPTITHIRRDNEAYRRLFRRAWQQLYGHSFDHDVLRAQLFIEQMPCPEAKQALQEYQSRIRQVKEKIEQAPTTPNKPNKPIMPIEPIKAH